MAPAVAGVAALLLSVACGGDPPATPGTTGAAPSAAPAILKTVDGVGLVPLSIEGFDALPPAERALAYYLTRAAIAGRDRAWNRDGGTVLELRDLLEEILTHPRAIEAPVREAIQAYLERFWIHTGNHDAWSGRKFVPTFTPADLRAAAEAARQEGAEIRLALGETLDAKLARLHPVLFDADYEPATVPRPPTSHGGVTTRRTENDRRQDAALRTLRGFIAKGAAFAPPDAGDSLGRLGAALADPGSAAFAAWSAEWIAGVHRVDLLSGPQPSAPGGDPLESEAWYGIASIADPARERVVASLADAAGELLAASPGRSGRTGAFPGPARLSARALLASVGPGGPATPEAVPFPVAGARGRGGFRALLLTNVEAAAGATIGRGVIATFAPEADRDRLEAARAEARFAFVALRALLGEGASGGAGGAAGLGRGGEARGREARGGQARGDASRAVLEAARADLLALHHANDPRLAATGIYATPDAAAAVLPIYLAEALAGLRGAAADGLIEAIDRRAQHLVLRELVASNAVVLETPSGRTEVRIADPEAARAAVAALLERAEAALGAPGPRGPDGGGAAAWVARSGTRAEPELVAEVASRAARAALPSRGAFLMPDLIPVRDAQGDVIDAQVAPAADFTLQMLRYSGKLPFEAPR